MDNVNGYFIINFINRYNHSSFNNSKNNYLWNDNIDFYYFIGWDSGWYNARSVLVNDNVCYFWIYMGFVAGCYAVLL